MNKSIRLRRKSVALFFVDCFFNRLLSLRFVKGKGDFD